MTLMTTTETKLYLERLYELGFTKEQLFNKDTKGEWRIEPYSEDWYEMIVSTLAVYYDDFNKDERLVKLLKYFGNK